MPRDRGARGAGLDGVLVVAKPPGPTSHDVVALVRRLSGTRRVGHGGTLDPFAAGVLPVFLGRATRLVEYHLGDLKRYRATICFGATSTTDDLEGELTPVVPALPVTRERLLAGLAAMEGTVEQRPPAYSAVKVGGRRAYALARTGQPVVIPPRRVTLHRLALVDWDAGDPGRPVAVVDVECSPGTYIRALARDLGEALGGAAYLGALVRIASGAFRLEEAVTIEDLRAAAAGAEGLRPLLRPIDLGLESMPIVQLTGREVDDVLEGRYVRPQAGLPSGQGATGPFRVRAPDGQLVAIAQRDGPRLAPTKVLADLPERHDELPDGDVPLEGRE